MNIDQAYIAVLRLNELPDSAYKPCPRCGTPTIMKTVLDMTGSELPGCSFYVGCFTCGYRTPNTYDPFEAIKTWNTGKGLVRN